MSAVLRTEGLSVRYGGNVALQPLDLELEQGRLITVVGSNGAGKSTLLGGIAGWSRGKAVVTGRVLLGEDDLTKKSAIVRARSGIVLVPESHSVFYSLSVEDNLTLRKAGHASGDRSLEEIYTLLPRLAERRQQSAGSLSGGQRQMLALGRALMANPRLLLLDEPSIGLAPQIIDEILAFVRSLVDGGMSVLLSEQNVNAALGVSDELVLLERGTVLTRGTPAELKDDPRLIDAYLGTESS